MNNPAAHQHTEGHAHALLRWSDDSTHDIDETAHYPLMTEAIRQILDVAAQLVHPRQALCP